MSFREDLKILLVREKMTLTELGKDYTVHGISQKLVRSSMKYDEMKLLTEILGDKIKFEKTEN